MMWKHKLKMRLREAVARWGYATGAWRLLNRAGRKGRVTFLSLHCVGFPEGTDYLPDYMKVSEADFDKLLRFASKHFDLLSLNEALRRLGAGERGRNALVVTLDDGYKDNLTHALPILEKHKVPAAVFLEVAAVDRRKLCWIHKYFFTIQIEGPVFLAKECAKRMKNSPARDRLLQLSADESLSEYELKKILKYETASEDRDRVMDEIFRELGGDERKLLDGAYLDWEDVKKLHERGVALGCHALYHPILSTLDRGEARMEILEAKRLMKARAGIETDLFAYPWGRFWDFTPETVAILQEAGFRCGLAMDERSTVPERFDPFRASRYPLGGTISIPHLAAEASGLYGLLGL